MSSPARFFAAASLVFGALFIALTPPFQTPDEPAHLFRAWSISEGKLMGHGGARVPLSLIESAADPSRRLALNPAERVFVPVVADPWAPHRLAYTAPSYTPLGYAAVVPAVLLGRLLTLSPVAIDYLGRAANLLASTLIIALAIRRAPGAKWALALAALTPMSVFMRASLSVDALTIACAFALVAEIARAEARSSVALSFVLAAIKPGYALLPLLALGVPRLRARRAAVALTVVAVLAGTITALIWAREAGTPPSPLFHPQARVLAAVHAPLGFAARMARELRGIAGLMAVEFVADFGWLDAPAPLTFALIWLAALVVVAMIDGPAPPLSRAWALLLCAGTAAAIVLVTYVYAPERELIKGLQGRYFLPVLPMFMTALPMRAHRHVGLAVRGLTLLAIAQSAWILVARYWI